MENSQETCLALIESYQCFPVLWDPRNVNYFNNLKKEDAWDELSAILNIPKEECRKKIESLRGSYRREKAKIKKTNTTGSGTAEAYKSKWFAFNAMAFLDKKTEPRETISSQECQGIEPTAEESESDAIASTSNSFKEPTGAPLRKKKERRQDG